MMGKRECALLLTLTCVTLLARCHSQGEEDKVHHHIIVIYDRKVKYKSTQVTHTQAPQC